MNNALPTARLPLPADPETKRFRLANLIEEIRGCIRDAREDLLAIGTGVSGGIQSLNIGPRDIFVGEEASIKALRMIAVLDTVFSEVAIKDLHDAGKAYIGELSEMTDGCRAVR